MIYGKSEMTLPGKRIRSKKKGKHEIGLPLDQKIGWKQILFIFDMASSLKGCGSDAGSGAEQSLRKWNKHTFL